KCLAALGVDAPQHFVTGPDEPAVPPPTPEELQPLFPQLEILRLIGQGGMGAVYEARQKGLNRKVALKILWVRADADSDFEDRFAREGRALAQL
ncbi:MAG: hypothetical protein JNK74_30015, partial [Candidatus Hydrogenedentes bacterium]|nr:hypothetical protein [Candidatus Hydrogenedentota bacterium]